MLNRTCLFSPMYLEGHDPLGNSRLERNIRYVDYYSAIKNQLGFEDIWFYDNHSSLSELHRFCDHFKQVHVCRAERHLERTPVENGYIYCWRAVYFLRDLIKVGYKKIIFIDSDCFILSKKMANYIQGLESGWTAFYSTKYDFPTAECHILCEDAFPKFLEYTSIPFEKHVGKLMERDLPFTRIEHQFKIDRYGETGEAQRPEMDAYSQARLSTPLTFS